MAAALCLTGYNLWEERQAEEFSSAALTQIRAEAPALAEPPVEEDDTPPDYLLDPEREMPAVESGGQAYIGVLSIPALGLELPVIEEWDESRLKIAPCRFEGSAYLDNLIIAGHNYRGHFGGLRNLRPGDQLSFTDMDGNMFHYTVEELETLGGNDLERLEGGEWDLTLFTCTLARTSRLVLRCTRC